MKPPPPQPPLSLPADAVVTSRADDFLERDGEMLVLAGSHVYLLSPVAAEAMRVAWGGVPVAELQVALVEVFGKPSTGNIHEVLMAILAPLVDQGLMVHSSGR
ncbi:hypothetical protein ON058_09560 [Demequina sp. B12]|uniref:hypothetical protein n=1 Tax=Demequina sp. B12 TaxID=2992757 RepID=UPI00237A356E|nr:hypothetical protein [Demequina sp. B12]MDE0573659.1 hypothetical protein [Demequina sp. B12]